MPWVATDFTEEEIEWLTIIVRRHEAEERSPHSTRGLGPLPPPPWDPKRLRSDQLQWIAIVMGKDALAWVHPRRG